MRKWLPLLTVCLGTFMLLVDVTIVTVALPSMSTDLHTNLSDLEWVLDVYALALAALLLGVGSTADQFGRRKIFVSGLVVFTAASLACALSPNGAFLIASRAVQGVGAAGMFGTTIALLGMHYQGKERGIALSVWGATNAVAAAVGPVLGGLLTQYLDWRWIFLINLPVGIAAIPLSLKVLQEYRSPVKAKTDFVGIITMTVSMAALTVALIRADEDGWSSKTIVGLFVLSALALILFIIFELRHPFPVLDLQLFRQPPFVGLMIAGAFMQLAAFAYLPYSSVWMQSALGYGAVKAGLFILPMSITAFIFAGISGRFDIPARPAISIGMLLISGGAALQALIKTDSSGKALLLGLLAVGAGAGLITPALSNSVLAIVKPERSGMAGGAMNTLRQLGFALGVAVFGTVLQHRMQHTLTVKGHLPHAGDAAGALASGAAQDIIKSTPPAHRAATDHLIHQAFASGLDATMLVASGVALIGAIVAVVMIKGVTFGESSEESDEITAVAIG